MVPIPFLPAVRPIHGSTAGVLVHGRLPSLNFSSHSSNLQPKNSSSPHFSPALSRPATHPLAATSLACSHGSTPASMDELLLLQRPSALATARPWRDPAEAPGVDAGCPLPTSSAAEGRHVPVDALNMYGASVSDLKKQLAFPVTFSKDFQKLIGALDSKVQGGAVQQEYRAAGLLDCLGSFDDTFCCLVSRAPLNKMKWLAGCKDAVKEGAASEAWRTEFLPLPGGERAVKEVVRAGARLRGLDGDEVLPGGGCAVDGAGARLRWHEVATADGELPVPSTVLVPGCAGMKWRRPCVEAASPAMDDRCLVEEMDQFIFA